MLERTSEKFLYSRSLKEWRVEGFGFVWHIWHLDSNSLFGLTLNASPYSERNRVPINYLVQTLRLCRRLRPSGCAIWSLRYLCQLAARYTSLWTSAQAHPVFVLEATSVAQTFPTLPNSNQGALGCCYQMLSWLFGATFLAEHETLMMMMTNITLNAHFNLLIKKTWAISHIYSQKMLTILHAEPFPHYLCVFYMCDCLLPLVGFWCDPTWSRYKPGAITREKRRSLLLSRIGARKAIQPMEINKTAIQEDVVLTTGNRPILPQWAKKGVILYVLHSRNGKLCTNLDPNTKCTVTVNTSVTQNRTIHCNKQQQQQQQLLVQLITFNVMRMHSRTTPSVPHWGSISRCSVVKLLHLSQIWATPLTKPSLFISTFTHSFHVFLPIPLHFVPSASSSLHADTQSLLSYTFNMSVPSFVSSTAYHLIYTHNSQTVHQLSRSYPIPKYPTTHPSQPNILHPFQSPHIIHIHSLCLNTQSFLCLRSTCPYHLSRPWLRKKTMSCKKQRMYNS